MEKGKNSQQFSGLINGIKEKLSASQIKCEFCGKPMSKDLKFCTWCGNKLCNAENSDSINENSVTKCPKCGALLEDGLLFCTSCGVKLEEDAIPSASISSEVTKSSYEPLPSESAELRVCKNCGAKINDAVDFCECCGLRINTDSPKDAKAEFTVPSVPSVISTPESNSIPSVESKDHDVTPKKSMKAYFKKPGNL